MHCHECGAELAPDAAFCAKCGVELTRSATSANNLRPRETGDVEEVDLWAGGYSGKAMIGDWVIAGIVSAILIVTTVLVPFFTVNPLAWMVVAGIIVCLWGFFLLKLAYKKISLRYELTTQRFIQKKGFLSRVTDRIELIDIDDVTLQQNFFDRMLNVGKIDIISSDRTHPELRLHGIANCHVVFDELDEARRKERRKRGLHIETI